LHYTVDSLSKTSEAFAEYDLQGKYGVGVEENGR